MNRKRSKKFFLIYYVSVEVLYFVLLIKRCNAGFEISSLNQEQLHDVNSITKSLLSDYNRLMKRQQGRDDSDNEEISELSRLQDAQMAATTSEGVDTQAGFNSHGNVQVPTDQNQPSLDALNNITNFLKAKEMTITDPAVDGGFTQWTSWSSCPEACGRTALRSRERYCTNPAPANGGKNCEGPRFQLKLCKIKQCSVDGGYSSWSEWSSCSQKCGQGMKKRRRHCNNPKPKYGGKQCKGARKQAKPCYGRICQDQDSIVDIDPRTVCGYNPCVVAKCIILPYATCVSDFKCRPVFFDSEERKVTQCKGDNLYLNVNPQTVCRFNPCKFTTCLNGAAAKCVINTRCHPVFLDAFGKVIKCKDRDHIIKEQEQDEEQEDGDGEDDADRLNKLMNSKLGIIDKDSDDDDGDDSEDDNNDDTDKDSSEEDRRKVAKSKLPAKFKLTTYKGLKRGKANRFSRHETNSKHGRLKYRRLSHG